MNNACIRKESIFALSQGMLTSREERDVQAHLEACPSCRGVFENYRRLDAVLAEWSPAAEPSMWFDGRVRAAAAKRPARSLLALVGVGRGGWLAAPALAALLVAASVVIVRNAGLQSPAPSSPPLATVAVAVQPAAPAPSQAGAQEIKLYQNLPVLEDYDMLANFDVISDLPQGSHKVAD
jgi:Putative zinc-finger